MYKKILHPTDLHEQHYALCEHVLALAKQFNASIELLHIIEEPASMQLAQGLGFAEIPQPHTENARAVLATLGEALQIPMTQQHVIVGSIKHAIIKYAQQLNCDLIIIGNHHASFLPNYFSSIVGSLVEHAPCDILTLKTTAVSI